MEFRPDQLLSFPPNAYPNHPSFSRLHLSGGFSSPTLLSWRASLFYQTTIRPYEMGGVSARPTTRGCRTNPAPARSEERKSDSTHHYITAVQEVCYYHGYSPTPVAEPASEAESASTPHCYRRAGAARPSNNEVGVGVGVGVGRLGGGWMAGCVCVCNRRPAQVLCVKSPLRVCLCVCA